jgi:hypothetical protein
MQLVPLHRGYALAKGYAAVRAATGADALVPAGLAWQAARGWQPIGERCREVVDAGFESFGGSLSSSSSSSPSPPPPPLPPIPLLPPNGDDRGSVGESAGGASLARWSGGEAGGVPLYRDKGPAFTSKYCSSPEVPVSVSEQGGPAGEEGYRNHRANRTVPCHIDHHPSAVGMYITAATVFATLTGESPIWAAVPAGELVHFDGDADGGKVVRLPVIAPADGAAAQRAARDVVAPYLSTWNPTLVVPPSRRR